jgi:hypothetical protein
VTACSRSGIGSRRAGEQAQGGTAGARRPELLTELELFQCQPPGLGTLTEDEERFGGLGAPAGEHRVPDAEFPGPFGGHPGVGQRLGGPVLGQPEPGAALQHQRRGERPRGRPALLARRSQRRIGPGQVVRLHQRVQQERQAPQRGRRRRHRQLVLEGEPAVRLGVAYLARPDQGHRPQHAAVGERDQPAEGARHVDERLAQRERGRQLVVEDQLQGRQRGQQGAGLGR